MQFMAAAVVVCGMSVLTSCEKDNYALPEVIESEVYDTGVSSEVTAESGTEGTKLSYESWIMVKGITRANFDNKVSVTLNNTLNNVTQTVDVVNYEIGIPQTTLVYTIGERHSKRFCNNHRFCYGLQSQTGKILPLNFRLPIRSDFMTTISPGARCLIIRMKKLRIKAENWKIWKIRPRKALFMRESFTVIR